MKNPPTIEEVRAYIKKKGWLTVDAQQFLDVNEGSEWHNPKTGDPYKYWKRVLATWYHNSLRYGESSKLCRVCGHYGEYTGKDDTGQIYWLCGDHKPKHENILPKELTDQVFKKVDPHIINVNNERNRQKDKLGVR